MNNLDLILYYNGTVVPSRCVDNWPTSFVQEILDKATNMICSLNFKCSSYVAT